MPLSDNAVILMAKNPRPGKVKTRLAQDIGEKKAVEAYKHLLRKTIATITEVNNVDLYIFHSPEILKEADWATSRAHHKLQGTGDLGNRMDAAFQEVLKVHKKAIIIGADCPLLNAIHLQKAFDKLNIVDVVLGPSDDGGYYLMGMKEPSPSLFIDIEWGQTDVFHHTLDKLSSLGASVFLLEELYDIDYLEDWERYQNGA